MIGYRIRRFLDAWRGEDRVTRLFLAWNAANTFVAFALLLGAFALLVVTNAPGYQRTPLLAYVAVAVAWLFSVFGIGPAYQRFAPEE